MHERRLDRWREIQNTMRSFNHITKLSRRFDGVGRSEDEGQAMKDVLMDGEKFKMCAQLNHFTLPSRRFDGVGRSEEGQAMKEVLIDGEKFKICAQ